MTQTKKDFWAKVRDALINWAIPALCITAILGFVRIYDLPAEQKRQDENIQKLFDTKTDAERTRMIEYRINAIYECLIMGKRPARHYEDSVYSLNKK